MLYALRNLCCMQKRPRSESGADGMLPPPGEGMAQGGVPSSAAGGMEHAAAAYLGAVPPDQQQHAAAEYGYPQEAEAYAAAAAQAAAQQAAAAAAGQGQMPGGMQVLRCPCLAPRFPAKPHSSLCCTRLLWSLLRWTVQQRAWNQFFHIS